MSNWAKFPKKINKGIVINLRQISLHMCGCCFLDKCSVCAYSISRSCACKAHQVILLYCSFKVAMSYYILLKLFKLLQYQKVLDRGTSEIAALTHSYVVQKIVIMQHAQDCSYSKDIQQSGGSGSTVYLFMWIQMLTFNC